VETARIYDPVCSGHANPSWQVGVPSLPRKIRIRQRVKKAKGNLAAGEAGERSRQNKNQLCLERCPGPICWHDGLFRYRGKRMQSCSLAYPRPTLCQWRIGSLDRDVSQGLCFSAIGHQSHTSENATARQEPVLRRRLGTCPKETI